MELVSLKKFSKESKILLLGELGYKSDGIFVLSVSGEKVIDSYINQPVKVDNMVILPGSEIILDDNPLSIASFIAEHGDLL